jgi:futalosine hydrolase
MDKRVLITASTDMELAAAREAMPAADIDCAVTGIGVLQTCYTLTRLLLQNKYQWIIQVGIAGAVDPTLKAGDVVVVQSEILDDLSHPQCILGVEGAFRRDLIDAGEYPFVNETLHCSDAVRFAEQMECRAVSSVTVSLLAKNTLQARQRGQFYKADIETMEGAAFFYVCLMQKVRFLQVRSISNIAGVPSAEWNIPLALERLKEVLLLTSDTRGVGDNL